jgi:hypothetical protein
VRHDTYPNTHSDSYAHTYPNTDSYPDAYSYADTYPDSDQQLPAVGAG